MINLYDKSLGTSTGHFWYLTFTCGVENSTKLVKVSLFLWMIVWEKRFLVILAESCIQKVEIYPFYSRETFFFAFLTPWTFWKSILVPNFLVFKSSISWKSKNLYFSEKMRKKQDFFGQNRRIARNFLKEIAKTNYCDPRIWENASFWKFRQSFTLISETNRNVCKISKFELAWKAKIFEKQKKHVKKLNLPGEPGY